jgi:hypothetical protein
MKFYETHYEDYVNTLEKHNFHPDKIEIYSKFPVDAKNIPNIIFYGPTGIGKYSQVLKFLKRYSPSQLKYEKKMEIQTEKQNYIYKISDIHYEIDMSLLGCNCKILWHEVLGQIVDIISSNMKIQKFGFIVCKNFHAIHNELLDIFYSYIQEYRNSRILLRFIILTENISFIPTNIIQCSHIINFRRPVKEDYAKYMHSTNRNHGNHENTILNNIECADIINIKELKSFDLIKTMDDLPVDIFNTVCDKIIDDILNPDKIIYVDFRDKLYDILVYNLDAVECIWNILSTLISHNRLMDSDIPHIVDSIYIFLKYYNNNYRPIYHLESIFFTIISKIKK